MNSIYIETRKNEELVNVITHLPGVLFGVVATILLLLKSTNEPLSHMISYIVYGLTVVLIYGASSIYHNCKSDKIKDLFKKIDHACIYIFMAGCYTPFVIVNMEEPLKYYFLALVWTVAIVGVVYKFLSKYKNQYFSVALYLAFGFMCFGAKSQFLDLIPDLSFKFLVYGGVMYGIGVIFYLYRKIPYHHGIWHIFVILGSACHFYAIFRTTS